MYYAMWASFLVYKGGKLLQKLSTFWHFRAALQLFFKSKWSIVERAEPPVPNRFIIIYLCLSRWAKIYYDAYASSYICRTLLVLFPNTDIGNASL